MTITPNSVLIVIPARAGSKGVIDKNLRSVAGIPLVARSVRTALQVNAKCVVTVSTDSDAIAEVSASEGAVVLRRPASIAGDTASSESAVLDVLQQLTGADKSVLPGFTIMLQCTSPFTAAEDIQSAIRELQRFDSVFTATTDHSFIWRVGDQGLATPLNHDITSPRKRRQDLDEVVRETGAVYGFRTRGFLREKMRFFGKVGIIRVPSLRAFEIDTNEDLECAQQLAPLLSASGRM